MSRRRLIIGAAALSTGTISGAILAGPAAAASGGIVQAALRHPGNVRRLALHSVNEGGDIAVDYWADGHYRADALQSISRLMRDRRSLEVGAISPKLVDLLYILHSRLDTREPIEIICGFRSPKTNAKMAKASEGVAKNSYHTRGMAADIRVKDRSARQIYKLAQGLGIGGVGYYGKSGFVHVDVGPPRSW